MNRLRERLSSGPLIGTHITLNDCQITEALGMAGFDYLWIDTEHTAVDRFTLVQHLIAAGAAQIPAIVRIPFNDPVLAKHVLEMGVDGIIFPLIRTPEDARKAVAACVYPPEGVRGFGPRRAIRYGLDDPQAYIRSGHRELLKIVQIETREAYENVEDIAAVEGVDILAIGPSDLSGAFGRLNQITHPEMLRTYRDVTERAHAAGAKVMVSYVGYSQKEIAMWHEIGIDCITIGGDLAFLIGGAREALRRFDRVAEGNSRPIDTKETGMVE